MTSKSSAPTVIPHPWSKDALLAKAQRYAEEMLRQPRDKWQFGFWSSHVLEHLARAALANASPALLADARDWNNLYFGLGFTPKATKFTPKSVDITTVLGRLRETLPSFDPALEGFALKHMARRNEEAHSGSTPFDSLNTSLWLPNYYQTCEVLLLSMGETLETLIGPDEAKLAATMIGAAKDESAKAVQRLIQTHEAAWAGKDSKERTQLTTQATGWATKHEGHRVTCPACENPAIVTGEASAAPKKVLEDDMIVESQFYLPSKFECIACGLKISGFAQLNAAGLGDTYKATFTYDAAEYYAPEDPYPEYEPDFNEY